MIEHYIQVAVLVREIAGATLIIVGNVAAVVVVTWWGWLLIGLAAGNALEVRQRRRKRPARG